MPKTEKAAPLKSVRVPGARRKLVPPDTAAVEALCRAKRAAAMKITAAKGQLDAANAELTALGVKQRGKGAQSTVLRGVTYQVVVEFRRDHKTSDATKLRRLLGAIFARFFKHNPETHTLTKEGRQFYEGDITLGLRNAARVRKQMANIIKTTEAKPRVGPVTKLNTKKHQGGTAG